MTWLIFLAAVLVGVVVHLKLDRQPRTAHRVVTVVLLYLLVVFAGLGGLLGALGHTFYAAQIAHGIGWPPGSPFQFEVAMANLAFGALGILCIWRRDGFWTATGVGLAVFYLGCAYGHLQDLLAHGNYAPFNAGLGIWVNDAAVPLTILGLLGARARLAPKRGGV